MRDQRLDKLADVIVRYSTKVKKGDLVAIGADPIAMPMVEAVFEAVLKAGGNPFWSMRNSTFADILFEHGTDEQLKFLNPVEMYLTETVDVSIGLWADTNTKSLSRVDSKKVAMNRVANGPADWTHSSNAQPKAISAGAARSTQHSHLPKMLKCHSRNTKSSYSKPGFLHLPDPVAAWEQIHARQQLVCDFLQTKDELHFKAPARDGHDGTDLRVNVDKGQIHLDQLLWRRELPRRRSLLWPTRRRRTCQLHLPRRLQRTRG